MKIFNTLISLLQIVTATPISSIRQARSKGGNLLNAIASELKANNGTAQVPRVVVYSQNRVQLDGKPLSLLPLLEHKTGVTHVILSSLHMDKLPGDIRLNDDPPASPIYGKLWGEVQILQAAGIKVMVMLGGAAKGSYSKNSLGGNETTFQSQYKYLVTMLRHYRLDGIDLDVEEFITLDVPLRLLKSLRRDMGPNFILTMAPVAMAMQFEDGINLSGFNYFELDRAAVDVMGKPLINWYNAQFYGAFGDPSTPDTYQWIIRKGWAPERIVMGVLTNSNDGYGFVETKVVVETVKQLRKEYPSFGGVYGWDYYEHIGGRWRKGAVAVGQDYKRCTNGVIAKGTNEVLSKCLSVVPNE